MKCSEKNETIEVEVHYIDFYVNLFRLLGNLSI